MWKEGGKVGEWESVRDVESSEHISSAWQRKGAGC